MPVMLMPKMCSFEAMYNVLYCAKVFIQYVILYADDDLNKVLLD